MKKEKIDPTIQDLRKLARYAIHPDIKLNTKDPITNAINIIALQGVDLESKIKTISRLENQLSETEEKLKRAYTEIVENWKQASGGCDDLYCVYCFWDEYDNKHEKDCIVLEAQTWLEDKE